MKGYLLTIAATLALAWVISYTYVEDPRSPLNRTKDRTCYFLICCILSLFFGLRIKYNDTYVYIKAYETFAKFPEFWDTFDSTLGANPGYTIMTAWMKTQDVSRYGFTLIHVIIFVLCSVYFFKKYNYGLLFSLFLFFASNTYAVSAAAIKQATAIALAILAVDAAIERKWIKYALLLLVAATFHPYVLLYGLVPLLFYRPWTKPTYILLAATVAIGFALESLLGTIVDIAALIGDQYSEEGFVGDGINVFRVLVANVPLFMSFLYRESIFRNSTREEHVIINLSMINGAVMFVGLFGNPIYFSRLATYFTFFQCSAIPLLLRKMRGKERELYSVAAVLGYAMFFVYANMMIQSFDAQFNRITLFRYLQEFVFKWG